MARIRTIKPEFPQSESMGRVSRESRLLFILLWTICDDAGRTRAASRMLASLLYPYDDDASKRMEGWLKELEREKCIVRYKVDGATYLEICKWLNHQKIDKPSGSKIPPFARIREDSRESREDSSEDLDLDLDQGPKDQGRDQGEARKRATHPRKRCPDDWQPPESEVDKIRAECPSVDLVAATRKFRDHEFARGRSDWLATWRNWMREEQARTKANGHKPRPTRYEELIQRASIPTDKPRNPLLIEGKL